MPLADDSRTAFRMIFPSVRSISEAERMWEAEKVVQTAVQCKISNIKHYKPVGAGYGTFMPVFQDQRKI